MKLKFRYSTAEFDSYKKLGFVPSESELRPVKREMIFLSQVDLSLVKLRYELTDFSDLWPSITHQKKRRGKSILFMKLIGLQRTG